MSDPVSDAYKKIMNSSGSPSSTPTPGDTSSEAQADSVSDELTVKKNWDRFSRRRSSRIYPTRLDGRRDFSPPDPVNLGSALSSSIKKQGWEKQLAAQSLGERWPEIVGEDVARHTTISHYDQSEYRLFVQCDATAWATQLKYMQSKIIATISREIGPGIVKQLTIKGPQIGSYRKGPFDIPGRGPRDTFG